MVMSLMRERAGSPSARLRTWVREKVRRVDLRVRHGSGMLVGVLGGVLEMAQTEPQPPRPTREISSDRATVEPHSDGRTMFLSALKCRP